MPDMNNVFSTVIIIDDRPADLVQLEDSLKEQRKFCLIVTPDAFGEDLANLSAVLDPLLDICDVLVVDWDLAEGPAEAGGKAIKILNHCRSKYAIPAVVLTDNTAIARTTLTNAVGTDLVEVIGKGEAVQAIAKIAAAVDADSRIPVKLAQLWKPAVRQAIGASLKELNHWDNLTLKLLLNSLDQDSTHPRTDGIVDHVVEIMRSRLRMGATQMETLLQPIEKDKEELDEILEMVWAADQQAAPARLEAEVKNEHLSRLTEAELKAVEEKRLERASKQQAQAEAQSAYASAKSHLTQSLRSYLALRSSWMYDTTRTPRLDTGDICKLNDKQFAMVILPRCAMADIYRKPQAGQDDTAVLIMRGKPLKSMISENTTASKLIEFYESDTKTLDERVLWSVPMGDGNRTHLLFSVADITSVQLSSLNENRIARLRSPYYEDFLQVLFSFQNRIGIPSFPLERHQRRKAVQRVYHSVLENEL